MGLWGSSLCLGSFETSESPLWDPPQQSFRTRGSPIEGAPLKPLLRITSMAPSPSADLQSQRATRKDPCQHLAWLHSAFFQANTLEPEIEGRPFMNCCSLGPPLLIVRLAKYVHACVCMYICKMCVYTYGCIHVICVHINHVTNTKPYMMAAYCRQSVFPATEVRI